MSELKAFNMPRYAGEFTMHEVYLKSEADKVIAHQKFKRCLAVARRCHGESLWWYSKGYGFEKYDKFWEKWEKRWLKLADKFKDKEAK